MDDIKRSYSREELHALVWSTPMQKLAQRFGLSDRGLAKICARHLIPVPPRGYWAKLEAGQSVKKTLLRKVKNTALHRVLVGPGTVSPEVKELLNAVKRDKKTDDIAKQKPVNGDKLSPVAGYLSAPIRQPNIAIRDVAQSLRKSHPSKAGAVSGYCVHLHQASTERGIAFLHNLAIRLKGKNLDLVAEEKKLIVKGLHDEVSVSLVENTRRQDHIPTKAELNKFEHLKKRYPSTLLDLLGPSIKRRAWEQFDIIYTGSFRFSCDGWHDGLRQSWSDGKTQRLEGMLDTIVEGLSLVLAYKNSKRERLAERERRRQDILRRRELAARRAEREEKRLSFLSQLCALHREGSDIRFIIETATKHLADAPEEYVSLVGWARERLAHVEAKLSVAGIVDALRAGNLFPVVDEFSDQAQALLRESEFEDD